MSALDDLLSDFQSNAGTMPAVNPPEASKVLAAQTAPEVAGAPEPVEATAAIEPPTEKPADLIAAEQAKTRKPRAPRGSKAVESAPTGPIGTVWCAPAEDQATEYFVHRLNDLGYTVTLSRAPEAQ